MNEMTHRRHFAAQTGLAILFAGLATLPPATSPAQAQQNYPNRPVRLIIPFGPGGIADITSRLVAERLGERLGQRFVIENQPGAGGVTAARSALAAPPDGYTLALLTNGTAVSVPLFKSLPFDPRTDFVPVSSFAYFDFVFATNAERRYQSLAEVIAAARERPGALNIGTINVGSSQNLSAELFKSTAGVTMTIVPYRTTPEVLVALLRNDIDLMIENFAALKSPLAEGKIRAVATSGSARSPVLPDAPTVKEAGVAEFEVNSWNGLFAPARTPPEIVSVLNTALREVLGAPDLKQRFLELGVEARASSPEEIGARLRGDIEKWTEVIARAGIQRQ
jgi:tripartite-type tricarboxylate transporter receptor subunit TctC